MTINITKLPTKRLLAYKRAHFPSENYPHFIEDHVHDCNCDECADLKKDIAKYKENYKAIREELAKRENVNDH